jgi:hypothetical protein
MTESSKPIASVGAHSGVFAPSALVSIDDVALSSSFKPPVPPASADAKAARPDGMSAGVLWLPIVALIAGFLIVGPFIWWMIARRHKKHSESAQRTELGVDLTDTTKESDMYETQVAGQVDFENPLDSDG